MNLARIKDIPGGLNVCPGCPGNDNDPRFPNCKLKQFVQEFLVRPTEQEMTVMGASKSAIKPNCPEKFNQ